MRQLPVETSSDPRFSTTLPGLQLQVNSSSLGPFKQCPRKYYYSIICGWESHDTSVHLTFGTLIHAGIARYELERHQGASHDDALMTTLRAALEVTWDKRLGRPWISNHPEKNRGSFIRSLVWYLEAFGQNEHMERVVLPGEALAVELPFVFDSQYKAESTGEAVMFYGTLDRLVKLNDKMYVLDTKTTKSALAPAWFKSFSPDNQFSLYMLAAQVVFGIQATALLLDGMQAGAGFTRLERGVVQRSEASLEEWLDDAHYWLAQMESCAVAQYWPQNDKACSMYGGCEFREICSASPASRELWLSKGFRKRAPRPGPGASPVREEV